MKMYYETGETFVDVVYGSMAEDITTAYEEIPQNFYKENMNVSLHAYST